MKHYNNSPAENLSEEMRGAKGQFDSPSDLTFTENWMIAEGNKFWIQGTVTDLKNGTNGFAHLQSIDGNLFLQSSQTTAITPGSGTLVVGGTGQFDVSTINGTGTTVNITGNVDSNSLVTTSRWENFFHNYGGGNTLYVSGGYKNEPGGQLVLNGNYYHQDFVKVGSLNSMSYVFVGQNATLRTPQFSNSNYAAVNGTMQVGTGPVGGPGYYQFANGTLGEYIDMNNFGEVVVGSGGVVILDGVLDVHVAPGFIPGVGSTYDIFNFDPGALNGVFSTIVSRPFNNGTEYWVVQYDNSGGFVSVTAQPVPEPSSLFLAAAGFLAGVGAIRRVAAPSCRCLGMRRTSGR